MKKTYRRKQLENWTRRMTEKFVKADSNTTFAEFCYEQGKIDGIKEFIEWLDTKYHIMNTLPVSNQAQLLDIYQKEQK